MVAELLIVLLVLVEAEGLGGEIWLIFSGSNASHLLAG